MRVKVFIRRKPNPEVLQRALDIALDSLRNRLEANLTVNQNNKQLNRAKS